MPISFLHYTSNLSKNNVLIHFFDVDGTIPDGLSFMMLSGPSFLLVRHCVLIFDWLGQSQASATSTILYHIQAVRMSDC